MNKSRFLALILASCMLLAMLSGCAPKDPGSDGPSKPQDDVKTDEKIRTDIVIGDSTDAKTMDPHKANDGYSARIFNNIYDSLLEQGPDFEVLPGLAKSWEYTSDTEVVFTLEEGVKFHNGDELKASDVKFSIDRMVASPQVASYFDKITEVTVIDDYKVSVKTSESYAPLLFNLAGTYGSIVSEKAITEAGDKYDENPVGTGPLKFKEWAVNDHITLTRHDDYFKGPGRTTSLTIKVIPEDASRTIALETGAIDFIQTLAPVDVTRVEDNKDLATYSFLSQSVNYLGFNCKKAPFDNVAVRQALNYAVNKESMVSVVLEGKGEPVHSMLAPEMPGSKKDMNLYPYDMEKAKKMLTDAGFPNGFSAKLVASGEATNRAAQLIQSDFDKIGVTLDLEMYEFGALLDYLNGTDHDMYILSYGAAGNPDSTMTNVFHSKSSSASGNRSLYGNPEADKLIEQAKTETEWDKRQPLYEQAQEIIMTDAPIIPLYVSETYTASNAGLEGVQYYKSAKHDLHDCVVKE